MASTVFKPAGIPVFPPHADPSGDCVLARLLREQPGRSELAWPPGFDGGIAHRLDISTSGALWLADDPAELLALRDAFAAKQLHKRYLLLAAKDVPWSHNRVEAPIAHDRRRKGRMIVQRGQSTPHRGRWLPAQTEFIRRGERLWEARMRTGVMHQIRVHAAFAGIPLLGDRRYGGGPTPDDAPAGLEFFLHHIGLRADDGRATDPVPLPDWAQQEASS